MGLGHSPRIVTDGMVLCLDAANPRNFNLTKVEVLVVGGGGGGGNHHGGGGGAGGLIYNSNFAVTPGTQLTATVGDGGAARSYGGGNGGNGGNSVFGALTAIGGGGGGSYPNNGSGGGSGGGSTNWGVGTTGGTGTSGQGFAGGSNNGQNNFGGGGGGAGGTAKGLSNNSGGDGLAYNISGNQTYYSGGGGSGVYPGYANDTSYGYGGLGGGGNGGNGPHGSGTAPTAGGTNTGGGGGGVADLYQNSAIGGSGIIIVRYPGPQKAIGGTVTSVGGDTIHTFTTSGNFTPLVNTNASAVLGLSDLSGNRNFGTTTGSPTYSSANGGSLYFEGSDEYITTGFTRGTLGNQSTLISWYKYTGTPGRTYSPIFGGKESGSGTEFFIGKNAGNTNIGVQDGNYYDSFVTGSNAFDGNYHQIVYTYDNGTGKIYLDGTLRNTNSFTKCNDSEEIVIGVELEGSGYYFTGNIAQASIYNRALTAAEISQNFNALRGRFTPEYETLTYTASGNLTVTGNGTNNVNIFKTSGGDAWDNQAYNSLVSFTAPCTIEFNKQAASGDNGVSYAMIGWNADPTTDASYSSIDYASYPYRTDNYSVYHNSSQVHFSGSWSTANKFYIVYGTDGTIKHYNGSTLLYSVYYGTGNTVYVDSSFYSVNSTFGGFSNIKVIRSAWNGSTYVNI